MQNNQISAGPLVRSWLTLKAPNEYAVVHTDGNSSTFRIEPLERGMGITLGNTLRRILLSFVQGYAVSAVRIHGVEHEYSAIRGVREDVMDIILNLKSLVIKGMTDSKRKLKLSASGRCVVTAGMIEAVPGVEIINPDLVLCHLEDDAAELKMDIYVTMGKGYEVANEYSCADTPGVIPVDAMFSPVLRVSYRVEKSRVGGETELDRLYLTIQTNGAVSPELALGIAAKIMQEQLKTFIRFTDVESVREGEESKLPFDPVLLSKIEAYELSVRAQNCLKNANITYLGDLVQQTEAALLKTPNFGKKSLNEIKEMLTILNLRLGMDVSGWPPENIEELSKKYEEEGQS